MCLLWQPQQTETLPQVPWTNKPEGTTFLLRTLYRLCVARDQVQAPWQGLAPHRFPLSWPCLSPSLFTACPHINPPATHIHLKSLNALSPPRSPHLCLGCFFYLEHPAPGPSCLYQPSFKSQSPAFSAKAHPPLSPPHPLAFRAPCDLLTLTV